MRLRLLAVGSMLVLPLGGCFTKPDVPEFTSLGTTTGVDTSTTDGQTSEPASTGVMTTSMDGSTSLDPDSTTGPGTATEPGTTTGEPGTTTGEPIDTDGDGVFDDVDNCPDIDNPTQGDADGDGIGDFCDAEVVDTPETLFVPPGIEYPLLGQHCYTGEVRILGTVRVVPLNGMLGSGSLEIRSEVSISVAETGQIDGVASGYPGGAPAPSNGGMEGQGPGHGCGGGPGSCVSNGGSGGGYGGVGGTADSTTPFASGNQCTLCSQATEAHCYGLAGTTMGTANGTDLAMGSGGGAGGNSCGCANAGGVGGRGGAMVALLANDLVRIDGAVLVDGESPPPDPDPAMCGYRPGGGGGAGGGLAIAAGTIEGGPMGSLSARGGNGGQALGDTNSTWGWAGGGGGGGRIKVFSPSNGFMGGTDVAGGSGGTAPPDPNSFAGFSGQVGTAFSGPMIPPVFASISCN